ncbi:MULTISPECIES: TrbG/VirB9 family P-type conjugative transfer protein [Brucella/Ochrobactrum group]|uniref:TrbG/VirB9 family P-type conjugative transfer protein n=1 Tax=Brucella/Ochrobactrum group TaxID=2826938 RepID=UPI001C0434DB|nr:TrbG/VirB9 family P-type conjugative transfer protein [Brucella sp. NBRC 12950]QWK80883.1 TrbG/VirB9 family P-type conjugative transfer protein [Ochrobactrum sp. BTU1]
MMKRLIIASVIGALPAFAMAETVPKSNRMDSRVREATYIDGQVFRVYTSLLRSTAIELPAGEVYNYLVAGDTEAIQYAGAPGGRVIAIKPILRGLNTNITLYSNKRAYYLNVVEKPNSAYFAVRFNGGYTLKEQVVPESNRGHPTGPYMNYGANVKNAITPTNVWDDGIYTYFEFYPSSSLPAIFKTLTGEESTVNSTVLENRVMRVSGLSNYWVLRSGTLETVVKRMQPGQAVKTALGGSHDR